jgi:hypothetical protein
LEDRAVPTLSLGAAANYALLAEGGGSTTVQITNVTTNVTGSGPSQGNNQNGNIGVGGTTTKVNVSGPSNLNGRIDIAAANTGQVSNAGNTITGGTNFNVSAVTSALSTVNALNTTLGALPGTTLNINGNTTINAQSGILSASGSGYTNVRVFTVTSFSLNNGQTLTINGDANNDSVVVNFPASVGNINFSGNVVLNGISPDNVIFNFVGGSNLTGGRTLQLSTGTGGLAQGIFLNPNGTVTVGTGNVFGRVFGGDSHDFQFNGPGNLTAPLGTVTPTLSTTPTTVTLGPTATWDSPEHRGDEVDALYRELLHRPAEPAGRAYWAGLLLAGQTEEQVAAEIMDAVMAAPAPAAASPAAFLGTLYADVPGRALDPAGAAYWGADAAGRQPGGRGGAGDGQSGGRRAEAGPRLRGVPAADAGPDQLAVLGAAGHAHPGAAGIRRLGRPHLRPLLPDRRPARQALTERSRTPARQGHGFARRLREPLAAWFKVRWHGRQEQAQRAPGVSIACGTI